MSSEHQMVKDIKAQLRVTKLEDASSFILGKTLGTGTFGRVRKVEFDSKKSGTEKILTNYPFALKMLKKSEVIRLKQVDHIMAERSILSAIEHPFIVNLFCCFQDKQRLYMLMEFVNGGELFTHLRDLGNFELDVSKFFSAEIVLAFEYLHGDSIAYRDLKPENLLIDHTGRLKITDFGFAKKIVDRSWTLCGTPEYLAPEIIQSKGHNKSVDWWALGILLFEMLAGYPPFYDENPFGIYQKILAGRIDFSHGFDEKAKGLIKKLLMADRTKRYGCLKRGAADVKDHKFFSSFNWEDCRARKDTPPASILNKITTMFGVKKPEDIDRHATVCFDQYPDSDPGQPLIEPNGEQQALFTGFECNVAGHPGANA